MKSHKDLDAWKQGIELVETIYKTTEQFPSEEKYGLSNQLRRAAVSVPSNVAEGAARYSKKEFTQFLYVALGSVSEVETQIIIAKKLHYVADVEELERQIERVRKLLLGLVYYLKRRKSE